MQTDRQSDFSRGALLLLMTVTIWGAQFPVAKTVFEQVNAFHSAIFRFGIAALLLALLLFVRSGAAGFRLGRDLPGVLMLGIVGMAVVPSLIFGALMFTRPEIAAINVAIQPMIAVVIQWIWGKQRADALTLVCVIAALVGVLSVITRWDMAIFETPVELVGSLMIFSGAVLWVVFTIQSRRYHHHADLPLTTIMMLGSLVGHVLLTLLLTTGGIIDNPPLANWLDAKWGLLFLALIGVLVAMYGWNAGSRILGPTNAALFTNLIPVVTFAIRFVQGYRFSLIEIFGACLVIAALLTQNLANRRRYTRAENT